MNANRGFDEVMIVNPAVGKGARLMTFHNAVPGVGYYAEAPDAYGYYAEQPDPYGYYAQPADVYGYYGQQPDPYGYYAQVPEAYGYYAAPGYGYFAEDPYSGYAEPPIEPVGYYAEEYPMGYYAEDYPAYGYYGEDPYAVGQYEPLGFYGEVPEMVGYGQYDPYSGMGFWGDAGVSGYVRATPPAFNAGCPMPTGVAGLDESATFEGYVKPSTVNPSCGQFSPQPGEPIPAPEAFKPLW